MNVLLVGLGSIAAKHIAALKQLAPSARIVALRSAKDAVPHPQVQNIYHLNELPFQPDFALISNPTSEHYRTIEELMSLSCPLFIEKPSLHNLSGAEQLLKKIRAQKLMTYIGCNLRFHPCVQFLKRYIVEKQPRINEVNIYAGSYLPDWRPGRDFKQIYSANPALGGGVHLDLIHELDYTFWFFGKPQQVQRILRSRSSIEIAAIDYAHYCLQYESFTAAITLNYYRKIPKRNCELVFDDDIWILDFIKGTIESKDKLIFASETDVKATYVAQMHYFLECLEKKQPTMNDIAASVEVLKICLESE